jgi:hypothetical protein
MWLSVEIEERHDAKRGKAREGEERRGRRKEGEKSSSSGMLRRRKRCRAVRGRASRETGRGESSLPWATRGAWCAVPRVARHSPQGAEWDGNQTAGSTWTTRETAWPRRRDQSPPACRCVPPRESGCGEEGGDVVPRTSRRPCARVLHTCRALRGRLADRRMAPHSVAAW